MKVYCKESYICTNLNFFKILGAGFGQSYTKWEKGKTYNARLSVGHVYIETENIGYSSCINDLQEFKKYFITIEEARDEKIKQILNNYI